MSRVLQHVSVSPSQAEQVWWPSVLHSIHTVCRLLSNYGIRVSSGPLDMQLESRKLELIPVGNALLFFVLLPPHFDSNWRLWNFFLQKNPWQRKVVKEYIKAGLGRETILFSNRHKRNAFFFFKRQLKQKFHKFSFVCQLVGFYAQSQTASIDWI